LALGGLRDSPVDGKHRVTAFRLADGDVAKSEISKGGCTLGQLYLCSTFFGIITRESYFMSLYGVSRSSGNSGRISAL
jgi:hypothetical protein